MDLNCTSVRSEKKEKYLNDKPLSNTHSSNWLDSRREFLRFVYQEFCLRCVRLSISQSVTFHHIRHSVQIIRGSYKCWSDLWQHTFLPPTYLWIDQQNEHEMRSTNNANHNENTQGLPALPSEWVPSPLPPLQGAPPPYFPSSELLGLVHVVSQRR